MSCQSLASQTSDSIKEMQKWYLDDGEILAHVNDVLTPHGFSSGNDMKAGFQRVAKTTQTV
jgi:hypothetical protein